MRAADLLQYDIFSNLNDFIVRVNTWSVRISNYSHPVTLLDSTRHCLARFQLLLDNTFSMFLWYNVYERFIFVPLFTYGTIFITAASVIIFWYLWFQSFFLNLLSLLVPVIANNSDVDHLGMSSSAICDLSMSLRTLQNRLNCFLFRNSLSRISVI